MNNIEQEPINIIDEKAKRFASICQELSDLYKRKNHDYGDSFSKSIKKYGPIAGLTRISDKFSRLESLILNKDREVLDESVQDTLKDMASYCIMLSMENEM